MATTDHTRPQVLTTYNRVYIQEGAIVVVVAVVCTDSANNAS